MPRDFTMNDVLAHYERQGWAVPPALTAGFEQQEGVVPRLGPRTTPQTPRALRQSHPAVSPVRLTLPYPPSVNQHLALEAGRLYLRKAQRDYRRAVTEAVTVQWFQIQPSPAWPLRDRLRMTICLHRSDNRAYDIDNPMKALLDALQHAEVYANDAQIDELHVYRGEVQPMACVTVTLASSVS